MKPATMNDNRHLNDVESYLQARVDALKRRVTDLETQLEHERATSKMLSTYLLRVATQNSPNPIRPSASPDAVRNSSGTNTRRRAARSS